MKVELIRSRDCPNVTTARRRLMRALQRPGLPLSWDEWDRADPDAPDYVRQYGSPTILVDGEDIGGEQANETGADCCRVYSDAEADRFDVAPSVAEIVAALEAASQAGEDGAGGDGGEGGSGLLHSVAVLPGLAAAALPKVTCPLCWPAYAGVLSALGLGFLLETAWLLPISAAAVGVAVGSLGWRAGRRRGFGPFWLGLVAAAVLMVAKFGFDSQPAMYAGAAVLFGAAIWNAWPKKRTASCGACATAGNANP